MRFVLGLVVLLGAMAMLTAGSGLSAPAADCSKTSVGLTPLTDLKTGRYHGYQGGLYPGGKNVPPKAYLKKGLAYAKQVKPRDASGNLASNGRVVLLSVGMSNTTQEFSEFKAANAPMDPHLVLVDGAQGGQDAEKVKDPNANYWRVVDQRLAAAGTTAAQVQAAWLKEAIAGPTETFPGDAKRLQADIREIVAVMKARFPNLRLVYVYLWTDGTKGRRSGLVWTCPDVVSDGTHPSPSGRQKVARQLLKFFSTNATAKRWFL